MKLLNHVLLLPGSTFSALILQRGSSVPLDKDFTAVASASFPYNTQPINSHVNNNTNSTGGIDPNASFLDDVPADEGGNEPEPSLAPLDPDLTSKKLKRATRAFGAETVTFDNGDNHYNLTWGKCATKWSQVVGRWTFFNHSTHDNVTNLDIYRDVCDHAGLSYNGGRELTTQPYGEALNDALKINTQSLYDDSVTALEASIGEIFGVDGCEANTSLVPHDELRKLLAVPNNYWTFVFIGTILTGAINTALYASAYPNNTAWQTTEAGVSASILFLASGIIGWIAALPRTANVDRQIAAGSVAAARQTTQTLVNVGSTAAGIVQSASSNALNSLTGSGSTNNLLQMGMAVSSEPGQPAVGGGTLAGTAGSNFAVAGQEATTCLTEVIIDRSISAIQDVLAQPAGISPFGQIQETISNQGGAQCP